VEGLNLEAVGVEYDKRVWSTIGFQTTNPHLRGCLHAIKFTADACGDPELSVPWQKKASTLTMPGARILIRNCSCRADRKMPRKKD